MIKLEEQWNCLIGFSNYYVSSYGRIFNVKTRNILKRSKDSSGYIGCRNILCQEQ